MVVRKHRSVHKSVSHWATRPLTKLGMRSFARGIKSQHELVIHTSFFPPPTMSIPSESLLQNMFAGLNADQLIAEEQEHQNDELPAPSVLGKRTSPSGDAGSDGEDDGELPGPGGESLLSRLSPATHPNPATLQMEQTIRRMAKRLKLSNKSTSLVEQFAQVSTVGPLLKQTTDEAVIGAFVGGATDAFVRRHRCNREQTRRVTTKHRDNLISNRGRA